MWSSVDSSEEMLSVVISGVSGNLYDLFTDFDWVCEDLELPGVLGVPGVVGCRGKEKVVIDCDSVTTGVEG